MQILTLLVLLVVAAVEVHAKYIWRSATKKYDLSPWSPWSPCSRSCGIVGRKFRRRICKQGTCEGVQLHRTRVCYPGVPCPKPWRPWGEWSPCSASCGQGTQIRHRECSGQTCLGAAFQSQKCFGSCKPPILKTSATAITTVSTTTTSPTTTLPSTALPTTPSPSTTPTLPTTTSNSLPTKIPLPRKCCNHPPTPFPPIAILQTPE